MQRNSFLVELSFSTPQVFQKCVSDCSPGKTRDLVSMGTSTCSCLVVFNWGSSEKFAGVIGREAMGRIRCKRMKNLKVRPTV